MTESIEQSDSNLSLTENAYLRFATIGFMYFSQGLPLGLFGVALPTFFAEIGFTKSEIATYLAIIGLPWAFKFFAGPLMDYVSFLIYGHRRPWVVIAQAGLLLTFTMSGFIAGFGDPNIVVLAGCGFVLNLFSSTQDVAVDGLAISVLKESERSKATALMFGSQKIGNLAGAVGGGLFLNSLGVSGACIAAAFTTLCLLMLPLLVKERSVEKRFPWSTGGQIAPEVLALKVDKFLPMLVDLFKKLVAPLSLFFILAFFCDSVAGGMLASYLPSFTVQDLGWDDNAYNAWYSTVNLLAAGIGLLLSPCFDLFGQRKCLVVIGALTVLGMIVFVAAPGLQSNWGWQAFIFAFFLSQHLFGVLLISACMQLVSPAVAASQFAIYMSIANLSSTIGTTLIAIWGDTWTFETIVMVAAVFVLASPVLFWLTHLGIGPQRDQALAST
ncbi:MAG: MFS transporter [Gammaproteobacteria bacterium]|nr:MFS transporter [Gammaproteobacteria bacterium]